MIFKEMDLKDYYCKEVEKIANQLGVKSEKLSPLTPKARALKKSARATPKMPMLNVNQIRGSNDAASKLSKVTERSNLTRREMGSSATDRIKTLRESTERQ